MKFIIAIMMLMFSTAAIPQTSLADAVREAWAQAEKPICIPHREYWAASATIFSLLMERSHLNRRIAELERQLAERK